MRIDQHELADAVAAFQRHGVSIADQTLDTLVVAPPAGWTGRDINRRLVDAGIYPSELVARTPTLEAAFLRMTGATL